jgi:hypothetical protein
MLNVIPVMPGAIVYQDIGWGTVTENAVLQCRSPCPRIEERVGAGHIEKVA